MNMPDVLGPNAASLVSREGFRLISTRRIALPIWRVDTQCRVLQTRRIPDTDEFVLRAIGLGIASPEEIAKFLNLPQELVDGVVSNLLSERHLAMAAQGTGTVLVLTRTGSELVTSLVVQKPVEKNVQFLVDGLSGDAIPFARDSLLTSVQLDDSPHLILEPIDDVDLELGPKDTDRFMSAMPVGKGRTNDTLLSVIGNTSATRVYRPAAGLLFQSTTDDEDFYLRVCIDGRIQEDVESALRERGVLSSLRLVTRISEDRNRVDRALSADLVALRTDDRVTESLRDEIVQLGSSVTTDVTGSAGQEITSPSVGRAANRLAGIQVRRLGCIEALGALQFSLSLGRAAILISTSRFWPDDQHDRFVDLLQQLLGSGVTVTLEVPADNRQVSNMDRECLARLRSDLAGAALTVWETKESQEANFIAIDGAIAYVFAGNPFMDVARSAERFGDDRPTVVVGFEQVQRFLSVVHGEA
jgi:hypothetical protein